MKRKIIINDKEYFICPYTTAQELELLEFLELNDHLTDDDYQLAAEEFIKSLKYNKVDLKNISSIETILLLLKIREYTIGSDIKLKITCPGCSKEIKTVVDMSNVYTPAKHHNDFDQCSFLDLQSFDNIDESVIPEDMDWDRYEQIHNNLKDYYNIYNLNFNIECPYCKHQMMFSIDTIKKALTFISEESLNSLLTTIHSLTYFDNITRSDVLEMTPIERLMEMSLLKKTREKLSNPAS